MKILFTGDVNWGERKYTSEEARDVLEEVMPFVEKADFVLPNLECPLGEKENYTPIKKTDRILFAVRKTWNF